MNFVTVAVINDISDNSVIDKSSPNIWMDNTHNNVLSSGVASYQPINGIMKTAQGGIVLSNNASYNVISNYQINNNAAYGVNILATCDYNIVSASMISGNDGGNIINNGYGNEIHSVFNGTSFLT